MVLVTVAFLCLCSSPVYWLVRPLFFFPVALALVLCLLRLFFLCVPLVLFLFTLSPLLFLFRLCLSLLSRSVFSFFSCSHMLCLSLFFPVLGSVLGWFFLCRDEDDGRVDLWFLSAFLPFSMGIFFLCLCSVLLCLFPHWFSVLAFSNLPLSLAFFVFSGFIAT